VVGARHRFSLPAIRTGRGLAYLLMLNRCKPEATADQIEQIASEALPGVKG
jgi:hypothetical protein